MSTITCLIEQTLSWSTVHTLLGLSTSCKSAFHGTSPATTNLSLAAGRLRLVGRAGDCRRGRNWLEGAMSLECRGTFGSRHVLGRFVCSPCDSRSHTFLAPARILIGRLFFYCSWGLLKID